MGGSFCIRLQRHSGQISPPFVVSNSPLSRAPTNPLTENKHKSEDIHLCTSLRTTQLQCPTIFPHRDGGNDPRQAKQMTDIRTALQQRLCTRHINRTISVLEPLEHKHQSTLYIRHSIFQTQLHHQSISHTRRRRHL